MDETKFRESMSAATLAIQEMSPRTAYFYISSGSILILLGWLAMMQNYFALKVIASWEDLGRV